MKLFILIFTTAFLSLSSCSNSEDVMVDNDGKPLIKATLEDDFARFKDYPTYEIKNVAIKGNVMTISFSYSGGCKEPDFRLIGSKMIQKSYPPKRAIKLYNAGEEDNCRELLDATISFDIRELAGEEEEIVLLLDGYDQGLNYKIEKSN